jgi:hypothetical protein
MGTAASHLARGKAAVAAHLELVPEFEKSIKKSLNSGLSGNAFTDELSSVTEVLFGEVVEEE